MRLCHRSKLLMNLGKEAKDAAWYYAKPVSERAEKIKDYVAFCEYLGLFACYCRD